MKEFKKYFDPKINEAKKYETYVEIHYSKFKKINLQVSDIIQQITEVIGDKNSIEVKLVDNNKDKNYWDFRIYHDEYLTNGDWINILESLSKSLKISKTNISGGMF